MRPVKFLMSVIIIAFFTTSCDRREMWGVKGKGESVSETRTETGFERIDLSIDADIYYTQDSIYKIEVIAQPNILRVLKTEVSGSELKISYIRNVWDHHKVKIYVSSPKMRGMKISGSGDIRAQNKIVTDNLDLTISGSGNISLPWLVAARLMSKISGSGNISVDQGTVDGETCTISGSGNINTEYVVSKTNTSTISGSGDIVLQATENLNVIISGSGDVRYRGKPSVSIQTSGSGKLIHIE
jgi:hypothetical protein